MTSLQSTRVYCIVGNVQERKILRIVAVGVWRPLVQQKRAIHVSFIHENHIFHQLRKFSPLKVSLLYGKIYLLSASTVAVLGFVSAGLESSSLSPEGFAETLQPPAHWIVTVV